MKKINWKRGVVTAVTAGLMLTSVPGVAMAEGPTYNQQGYKGGQIVKTWSYDNSPYDSNYKFEFDLNYNDKKGPEAAGTNGTSTPTLKEGQDGKAFIAASTNDTGSKSATGSANLIDLVNEYHFDKPGSYYFTLSELDANSDSDASNDNPNVTFDAKSYEVRVDVVWKLNADQSPTAETEIQSVFVFDGKNKVDGASFNNSSTATAEDDNLKIEKKVAGTAANTQDPFTFTLQLSGVKGEYSVQARNGANISLKKVEGQSASDATTVTNGTYTFSLKHGEWLEIVGLPVGAEYTVSESDTDYTETNSVDGTASTNGLTTGEQTVKVDKDKEKSVNKVVFTNEKGFAPGTGITMNTLPFVGVGVVAAAGAVTLVISRKRRAGEDF